MLARATRPSGHLRSPCRILLHSPVLSRRLCAAAALPKLDTIQLALEGHVATMTVNRPKALNALSAVVVNEMGQAITALEKLVDDSALRCLIITGAGEKSFVAGADIAGMSGMSEAEAAAYAGATHEVFERIDQFPTPTLAAVNGFALGGGCELAMACDVIYASERAKFGQPEVKLGLMPGFAGTVRLPRRVGLGAASEWILTGNLYTANDAKDIGLVQSVLPDQDLMPHVKNIAQTIASRAPLAVRASKKAITQGLRQSFEDAAAQEVADFAKLFLTKDAQEGCDAFVNKREAEWVGA